MSKSFNALIAGALASATLVSPAAAGVVYDQPGTSAACAGYCWTSTSSPQGGFRTFDDFTLPTDEGISTVTWRGFIKPATGGPVDPAISDWELGFFTDNAGVPGPAPYNVVVSAADVTTTFLGVGDFNGPVNVYEFSATLPFDFAAAGGMTYWFSPLAIQPDFFPFFSWSPAANTSGTSFQASLPPGTTFTRPGDRAFSLGAVPEPQTWALTILGFGAVGVMIRRRRALAAI